jgi:hypothetical protein
MKMLQDGAHKKREDGTMKNHIYRVSGYTKKGGMDIPRAIDLEADNKAEAIELAKQLWYDVDHHFSYKHLFHIGAERIDDQELKYNFWHICKWAECHRDDK